MSATTQRVDSFCTVKHFPAIPGLLQTPGDALFCLATFSTRRVDPFSSALKVSYITRLYLKLGTEALYFRASVTSFS